MMMNSEQLKESLIVEHIEEVSVLFDQKRWFLRSGASGWTRIERYDDRMEWHIDAIVLGGNGAIDICRAKSMKGDAGDLHASLRALCRVGRNDLVREIVLKCDYSEQERIEAVCDALCVDLPESLQEEMMEVLIHGDAPHCLIAARFSAYRKIDHGMQRLGIGFAGETAQGNFTPVIRRGVLEALGRLRSYKATELLITSLQDQDNTVAASAINALMRMGRTAAYRACRAVPLERWPSYSLGLYGGRNGFENGFFKLSGPFGNDAVLSLGLLGDIDAVPILFHCLEDPRTEESAATALHLLTGAGLFEEKIIRDEWDDDPLPEGDNSPEGKKGYRITRLSRNLSTWKDWMNEQGKHLRSGIRYRYGKICSPDVLMDAVESEDTPGEIRRLACDELVIRYGIDLPLTPDMPVPMQRDVLRQTRIAVQSLRGSLAEGSWTLYGKEIDEALP
jgi:hypothetical protein